MATNYTAKDITVLEGLEPVRKRPGMYIGGVGTAGLHHLVWEILDNAVDEAMNGFASNIVVTLHDDGSSITIADDGRGIPVDKHPATKKSALEVIFTVLHAGGKFEQGNYKTAGGLHGVGASVVNALSTELRASVKRDGAVWEMSFKRGKPTGPLKKAGAARGTGTTVYFHPDPTIFPKVEFDAAHDSRAARDRQLHPQGRARHVRERGGRHEGGLPAPGRPVRLPEEDRRASAARSRCTRRRSCSSARAGRGSTSCCSGPRRPTSTCAATSTAFRPAPAARTRTGCAPGSARRCATTSTRTTCRRRASR